MQESYSLKNNLLKTFYLFAGNRYCPMLHKEKGSDILYELVYNKDTEPEVVELAENVLELMKPHIQNSTCQY